MTVQRESEFEPSNCKKVAQKDKKLPAMQFYPGDWRKDIGIQALSFHDRGVWFEMLMLMHCSERRGVLLLNGQPMTDEMIARAIGLDNQTFNQSLTTLLSTGVASREDETGAVMNRRMVRDEYMRKIKTAAGFKGGNPALLNRISTTPDKQNETPSSSISTSNSKPNTKTLARSVPPEELAETLPLVDGTSYQVSNAQVREWSQAYPAVDAIAELRKIKSWFNANPNRRKTPKGIARFIIGWLSRAQDKPAHLGGFNGNRAQQRTEGNIAALRRAFEDTVSENPLYIGGGETGGGERINSQAVCFDAHGLAC